VAGITDGRIPTLVDNETKLLELDEMGDTQVHGFAQSNVDAIERVELEGGAVKLRLQNRVLANLRSTAEEKSGRTREAARIITMAWGERYITDLLALTIPAAMAPGNIPAFAEDFDCEFVIVTETRLFDRIILAPVIQHLLSYCELRLVPIDDLLSPWYGVTLTYALVRGFVDLGEAMTKTHLVFLNADFIVADGSYRKLAEVIRQGERLVVSPSYCMMLEQTIEKLREQYDEQSGSLSISRRAMAAMIIENRHNTIRAKTVNQRLFRIRRYDQFYWYVDDRTLVARQMPIAVVYMRPERVLTEMRTFWDYGVISEFCPTLAPCVLSDSDDFLMGELRAANTFNELLHLGWPSIGEIAADLSSFTTKDHRDYGRFTLVLHSGDLPPNIESAREKLAQFVDRVTSGMAPPISYLNHPFWADAFPRFSTMVAVGNARLRATLHARGEFRKTPQGAEYEETLKTVLDNMLEMRTQRSAIRAAQQMRQKELARRLTLLRNEFAAAQEDVERGLASTMQADAARLRAIEDECQALEHEYDWIAAEIQQNLNERLESTQASYSASRANGSVVGHHVQVAAPTGLSLALAGAERNATHPIYTNGPRSREQGRSLVVRFHGAIAPLYRRIFGQLPYTTPWHPYHAVLQPALRAILSSAGRISNVLVVSSGGSFGSLLVRPLTGRKVNITPGMASMAVYGQMIGMGSGFDLCLCDLSFDDLLELRTLLETIRPSMAPGGKIVVLHRNTTANRDLDRWTYALTSRGFPLFGQSHAVFTGSFPGTFAARHFEKALQRYSIARPSGILSLVMTLAICGPLARLGMWLERRRNPEKVPKRCSSMTIEIDLIS
jgi:transcriptional regulator with XRE-family HTH domain